MEMVVSEKRYYEKSFAVPSFSLPTSVLALQAVEGDWFL